MKGAAIITARGGSKRIPRKNIRAFCGKPILAYSIEAAKESGLFDAVMVSTDDGEIAAVAREYGAAVPFMRSAAAADDFATTADVLTEVLDAYEARGRRFPWMCCLYPTAPFVTAQRLREAYRVLCDQAAEAVLPVVRFSYPPQRAFVLRRERLVYASPEYIRARSQDLEPLYHDAGQFYFYDVAAFRRSIREDGARGGYALDAVPLVLEEREVQDIDTLSDWMLAEMKYRLLHGAS